VAWRRSIVTLKEQCAEIPPRAGARTLLDALEWHAARHPDRVHLTVLDDDGTTHVTMSYRELAEAAREAAQARKPRPKTCRDGTGP
jgi:hypothetical protein